MKELSKEQFQGEVLKEYAGLVGQGAKPGAETRGEAEKRVQQRLSAQQPSTNGKDTTEANDWRKDQIWFQPQEVKEILAVGIAIGVIIGILFAIFVLFVAITR